MKNLDIKIISREEDILELFIRGIDAPIANALRRIIIDDVS